MSDSSRLQFRVLAESTWGTTPASAMTNVRITGESLNQNSNYITSNEINATAQNSDVVRTQVEGAGSIDFELSYGNLDDLLEGAFRSDWTTALSTSGTDIAASNTNSNFTSSSTDFTGENLNVGQWIKVAGFTGGSGQNNGYYQITDIAANDLGVVPAPAADEAAGDTVTFKGSHLANGTTAKSFSVEKEFTDITQFMSFTGMRVGTLDLSMAPGQIMTGSIGFQGKQGARAGATIGTGSATAAPTNTVMNAVDNVSLLKENGAAITEDLTQVTISLNNALRPQPAIGSLANVGIGSGTIEVTGTITAYFADGDLLDKYLGDTASSLSFLVSDAAGNAYMITMNQLKFTSSEVVAGGKDQDVLVNLGYTAYKDATYGTTITIDRFPA